MAQLNVVIPSRLRNTFTRGGPSHTVQMDWNRGKEIPDTESHIVTSVSRPTPELDKFIPRVRQRIRYRNRQCVNATHRVELVSSSLLYESQTLGRRTQLVNDQTQSIRYDLLRKWISTLPTWTKIRVSRGPCCPAIPSIEAIPHA